MGTYILLRVYTRSKSISRTYVFFCYYYNKYPNWRLQKFRFFDICPGARTLIYKESQKDL
ncbi:hypothetical protein [Blautia phage Montmirail]|nr:hypothetical protein [Blautia phage Montmirail]